MTDTLKIRLIREYTNLLEIFAKNAKELKEGLRWSCGAPIGFDEVRLAIEHLSKQIKKIEV